ncbi:unnamed protein product [Nesidiocoris tenuis]|uniref:Uncharacterized protein n=1 Tax=Nesidiocoris tenuis TaxID=355587 RepID=A0A6H5G0T0_9HEMI|nr:unnamed protein product [Nesidiocoris tenuis]
MSGFCLMVIQKDGRSSKIGFAKNSLVDPLGSLRAYWLDWSFCKFKNSSKVDSNSPKVQQARVCLIYNARSSSSRSSRSSQEQFSKLKKLSSAALKLKKVPKAVLKTQKALKHSPCNSRNSKLSRVVLEIKKLSSAVLKLKKVSEAVLNHRKTFNNLYAPRTFRIAKYRVIRAWHPYSVLFPCHALLPNAPCTFSMPDRTRKSTLIFTLPYFLTPYGKKIIRNRGKGLKDVMIFKRKVLRRKGQAKGLHLYPKEGMVIRLNTYNTSGPNGKLERLVRSRRSAGGKNCQKPGMGLLKRPGKDKIGLTNTQLRRKGREHIKENEEDEDEAEKKKIYKETPVVRTRSVLISNFHSSELNWLLEAHFTELRQLYRTTWSRPTAKRSSQIVAVSPLPGKPIRQLITKLYRADKVLPHFSLKEHKELLMPLQWGTGIGIEIHNRMIGRSSGHYRCSKSFAKEKKRLPAKTKQEPFPFLPRGRPSLIAADIALRQIGFHFRKGTRGAENRWTRAKTYICNNIVFSSSSRRSLSSSLISSSNFQFQLKWCSSDTHLIQRKTITASAATINVLQRGVTGSYRVALRKEKQAVEGETFNLKKDFLENVHCLHVMDFGGERRSSIVTLYLAKRFRLEGHRKSKMVTGCWRDAWLSISRTVQKIWVSPKHNDEFKVTLLKCRICHNLQHEVKFEFSNSIMSITWVSKKITAHNRQRKGSIIDRQKRTGQGFSYEYECMTMTSPECDAKMDQAVPFRRNNLRESLNGRIRKVPTKITTDIRYC